MQVALPEPLAIPTGIAVPEAGPFEAVDDVDAAVTVLTDELLLCSPQGLRETKVLLTHGLLEAFAAGRDRVAEQSSRLFQSEEAQEGMIAFLQRRPPRWAPQAAG